MSEPVPATDPEPTAGARLVPAYVTWAIVLCVLALYFAHTARFFGHINDDAYITFRYSRNLVEGSGPYFNPGEPVEGYTSLSMMLLMAAVYGVGGASAVPVAAKLLGVASGALCLLAAWALIVWLGSRAELPRRWVLVSGAAATGLLAASPGFAVNSTSGLETTLFAAAITGGAYLGVKAAASGRGFVPAALCFGLAVLTRPEGALLFAVFWLALALAPALAPAVRPDAGDGAARRRAPPWHVLLPMAALVAATFVAHSVFRFVAYDGELVPNTYHAKAGGFWNVSAWEYVRDGAFAPMLGPLGVLAALAGHVLPGPAGGARRLLVPIAAVALTGTCLPFVVGTDWMIGRRFVVPYLPLLAVVVALGWQRLGARLGARLCDRLPAWLGPTALLACVPLCFVAQRDDREWFAEYVSTHASGYRNGHVALAEWLRDEAAAPGDTIALMDIGIVGYLCREQRILDVTGLTDRYIGMSPGGFMQKRYDPRYVLDQEPRFIVLALSAGPVRVPGEEPSGDAKLDTFSPIADRIAEHPAFHRWYRRLEERATPDAGWREQLRRRLGATRLFLHDDPTVHYLLAVFRRKAEPDGGPPAKTAEEWFADGVALSRAKRPTEALFAFQSALELDPANLNTLGNEAYCFLDLGRNKEAADVFERILAREPAHWAALFGLALARQSLGDRGAALELWRRYVADAPDTEWKEQARRNLGELEDR